MLGNLERIVSGQNQVQMPVGAIGQGIGAVAGIAGSFIGAGKRRRAEKAAQAQYNQDLDQFRNQEFTNTYANLENTAEDLTVNQQATNVQAQQTDAALAGGLDAVVAGGGGGGGAQAIANAALRSKAGLSADLAGQESANQAAVAAQAATLQADEAAGADVLQTRQDEKKQQLLNLSTGTLGAAKDARQQARSQLVGGIGQLAGAAAGPLGGLFGKK